MKQFSLIMVVFMVLIVIGCASSNLEAKAEMPSQVKVGEQTPIKLTVIDHGQPVSGVEAKAFLEMKRMDHGNEQIVLKEQGKGEYVGTINPSMEGDWVANFEISKEGSKKEFEYNFKVEGTQK